MGSFTSFWVVLLLVAGESVSSDDDEEKFTVTDGTFTQCPNKKINNLSRWLSQRSDVNVSLWLLSYTGLENVWCKEDKDAECRGVSRSITLGGVSTSKKGKYKCVVRKSKKEKYKQGFTLIALRGAASHSNPVPEGSPLNLTCEGWGLSEVQRWEWTHNSAVISGIRKYMNNASLNTLTIRSLEKSDGGTYRCKPVFQQIGREHPVFLIHTVMISGSDSTEPTVSTPAAGGRNKTESSTTCCYSVSPTNSISSPSATGSSTSITKKTTADPNGSSVPPSTPDPRRDTVVRIVVPVVLIILVVLGIGAFCLIKRKRSQAQDVNSIIANPMDGEGDDPEVNYTTVNLNKLPSSDRQPGPVTEQTLYSQVKVN